MVAPLYLNDPVFWRASHLKRTVREERALKWEEVRTGVRWTRGAMREAADVTSWYVMQWGGMEGLGGEAGMC